MDNTVDAVFGPPLDARGLRIGDNASSSMPVVRDTNQYALAQILLYRLSGRAASQRCTTTNASEADLFFVPVLARPKAFTQEFARACAAVNASVLVAHLPHLNSRTACRHFFVVSKGHYNAKACDFFARPRGLLASALRVSYSYALGAREDDEFGTRLNDENPRYLRLLRRGSEREYPQLFSVPYPSSVHWAAATPDPTNTSGTATAWRGSWPSRDKSYREVDGAAAAHAPIAPRPTLMLFLGSAAHGDMPVRSRILEQCRRYNDTRVCNHCCATTRETTPAALTRLLGLKAAATFCLEPGGDSPFRKSLSDSIAFGCVPVLFSNLTDAVAPWFWGAWRDEARVLVPRAPFVAGEIDLRSWLSSIPHGHVRVMQHTIARHKHRFQYSVDDDPGDGVGVLLRGLGTAARASCTHHQHGGVVEGGEHASTAGADI